MKTTKEVKQENKEVKTKLEELIVLWLQESKNNNKYLSGRTYNDERVIGFFNTNKKNPKEPDVRVFSVKDDGSQEIEIVSLWENIGKNETRYLSGLTNENEKVVAFYGDEHQEKRPYVKIYLSK